MLTMKQRRYMDLLILWEKRWPKFHPRELLSPEGLEHFAKGHMVMQPDFLDKLHAFREFLGLEFLINHGKLKLRGWRSWAENLSIDGKLYHPLGVAADVTVKDTPSAVVADEALKFGFHGVGVYDTFCHIDLRPRLDEHVFRWDFRTKKDNL